MRHINHAKYLKLDLGIEKAEMFLLFLSFGLGRENKTKENNTNLATLPLTVLFLQRASRKHFCPCVTWININL